MKLREIYKIADSKESYTKGELLQIVKETSSEFKAPKFKDKTQKNNTVYRITIVFPIYNEESFLQYSINSFLDSYIYPNTSYQILFILNSCTDNSLKQTKKFLTKFKTLQEKKYSTNLYLALQDKGLDEGYFYSKDLNCYYILNTSTKGRVNALKIATKIAKLNKSQILMSFDTDFILDSSAIYNLSKEAIKNIVQKKNTVTMTGSPIMVNSKKTSRIAKWLRNHFVWKDQKYNSLSGCCLILEPNWLDKNIEENIVEDYTLGIKARSQGFKILKVENARMWGYRTNYKDDIQQLSRSIKGRYQLLEKHPDLSTIILNDHFFIQSFYKRLSYILKNICKSPKHILKWLWTFLFVEAAVFKAKKDYKRNPNLIDWQPLDSGR